MFRQIAWLGGEGTACFLLAIFVFAGTALAPVAQAKDSDETAVLGLAKTYTEPRFLGDRTFRTRIILTLENLSNVAAINVALKDDLGRNIGRDVDEFRVIPGSVYSADLIVNTHFNGKDIVSLLATGNELPPGGIATVAFDLEFRTEDDDGALFNSAYVWADNAEKDRSHDGFDPDPNGDDTPLEQAVTCIFYKVPRAPLLGLAKAATPAEFLGDNAFSATFTLTLTNYGSAGASQVQIDDDLISAFAGATTFEVEAGSVTGSGIVVNPNFNGSFRSAPA